MSVEIEMDIKCGYVILIYITRDQYMHAALIPEPMTNTRISGLITCRKIYVLNETNYALFSDKIIVNWPHFMDLLKI